MRAVFLIFIIAITSCQKKQEARTETTGGKTRAAVFLSAGDIYPGFDRVPVTSFFNIGRILTDKSSGPNAIILSKGLRKGSRIDIEPLAFLSFTRDTMRYKYIISTPSDEQNPMLSSNYNDLLNNNMSLQSMIENWFIMQSPENSCRNFEWQNTYKALLEINRNNTGQ